MHSKQEDLQVEPEQGAGSPRLIDVIIHGEQEDPRVEPEQGKLPVQCGHVCNLREQICPSSVWNSFLDLSPFTLHVPMLPLFFVLCLLMVLITPECVSCEPMQ